MQRQKGSSPKSVPGISTPTNSEGFFRTFKFQHLLQMLTIAALALTIAPMARAAADRTWVASFGDDANPCSLTAPCKTFAGAISKTNARGEIDCIDANSVGAVTVTKTITLDGGANFASILASGTVGITIDDGGANTAIVRIRNLSIQGNNSGTMGIQAVSFGKLEVENCRIMQFKSGNGRGISVQNSDGAAEVMVQDTIISNCSGSAIFLGPANVATAAATATLYNTTLESNVNGLKMSTGRTTATVEHSNLNFNSGSAVLLDSGDPIVNMHHNQISHNGTAVAVTIGQANIGDSYISNNTVSVSGNVHSWSDNMIVGNGTNTLPTEDLTKH